MPDYAQELVPEVLGPRHVARGPATGRWGMVLASAVGRMLRGSGIALGPTDSPRTPGTGPSPGGPPRAGCSVLAGVRGADASGNLSAGSRRDRVLVDRRRAGSRRRTTSDRTGRANLTENGEPPVSAPLIRDLAALDPLSQRVEQIWPELVRAIVQDGARQRACLAASRCRRRAAARRKRSAQSPGRDVCARAQRG